MLEIVPRGTPRRTARPVGDVPGCIEQPDSAGASVTWKSGPAPRRVGCSRLELKSPSRHPESDDVTPPVKFALGNRHPVTIPAPASRFQPTPGYGGSGATWTARQPVPFSVVQGPPKELDRLDQAVRASSGVLGSWASDHGAGTARDRVSRPAIVGRKDFKLLESCGRVAVQAVASRSGSGLRSSAWVCRPGCRQRLGVDPAGWPCYRLGEPSEWPPVCFCAQAAARGPSPAARGRPSR